MSTECQIVRFKIGTKFNFRWGSTADPAGGAYSAPQTPWLYLWGLRLRERGRKGKKREKGIGWGKGKGR